MAIPMCAALSVGASLTPSPIIAAIFAVCLKRFNNAQLVPPRYPRKDGAPVDAGTQRRLIDRLDLASTDHIRAAGTGYGERGCRIVARDHDDANACSSLFHRFPDTLP
jgi:hypothetical protein